MTSTAPVDEPDQLRKLAELRDSGILTSAEFEAKKAELLARTWSATSDPISPIAGRVAPASAGRKPNPRAGVLLIVLLILVGAGYNAHKGPAGGLAPVIGGLGWTRSANYTTCGQWATEMTPANRAAMASELLPILRGTVDTAADDGTALVPAFVDAIGATCTSSAVTDYEAQSKQPYVITAAAALAFTQDARFRP